MMGITQTKLSSSSSPFTMKRPAKSKTRKRFHSCLVTYCVWVMSHLCKADVLTSDQRLEQGLVGVDALDDQVCHDHENEPDDGLRKAGRRCHAGVAQLP